MRQNKSTLNLNFQGYFYNVTTNTNSRCYSKGFTVGPAHKDGHLVTCQIDQAGVPLLLP